jgi:UDP-N-acetylmuramyl tripeptide synthase
MQNILFILSILAVKTVAFFISFLKLGQASNLPGKIALKIKKDILKQLKFNEDLKIIVITGTNGKSTTSGMLTSIFRATGKTVITNSAGANLLTGIITTLCRNSSLLGKINADFLVLEVDEATLKYITEALKVDLILVTNLFRDQLDRFGELDTTAKLIEEGIKKSKNAQIVLNADDPRVAFLKTETTQKKIYYGLSSISNDENSLSLSEWMKDPEEEDYKCSHREIQKPELNFLISDIKTDHLSTYFNLIEVSNNLQKSNFFLPMVGIFNLYNAASAIAIAKTISSPTQMQIQKAFQAYSTLFGRGEKIAVKNKTAWIYLIKNPIGTTEVLKTLSKAPNARFLIAINDNFADGRDVSWLWDARFELLSNSKKEIFVSGKRAFDMALRLKYANVKQDLIKVNENIKTALYNALNTLEDGETLYVLPTYTVLLEMQRKKLCKSVK